MDFFDDEGAFLIGLQLTLLLAKDNGAGSLRPNELSRMTDVALVY